MSKWPKSGNKVSSYCHIGNKQNQINLLLPEHSIAADYFALLFLAINNKFLWIMKIKNHARYPKYSAASKLQQQADKNACKLLLSES